MILFFDIDGTLLNKQMVMPQSAKDAISRARANGHICMINTGRCDTLVRNYLSQWGEFDGCLYGCGTMVRYQGQVLKHNTFNEKDGLWIIQGLRKYGIDAVLEGSENNYHDDLDSINTKIFRDYMLRFRPLNFGNFNEAVGHFDKLYCYVEKKSAMEDFQREYHSLLDFIDRNGGFYELVPKGFSKASAMGFITEYLKIPMEDTAAIGDSNNDISMLGAAGKAIAMKNSSKQVLEMADFVTTDVDQDGILNALQWLGVI